MASNTETRPLWQATWFKGGTGGAVREAASSQITCFSSKYQNIYLHSRNFALLLPSHILSISLRVHTTQPLFPPSHDTHSVTQTDWQCAHRTSRQATTTILGFIVLGTMHRLHTPYYLCILALIHYSHPLHPSIHTFFFKYKVTLKTTHRHEVFPLASKVMKKKDSATEEKTASLLAEQSL